MKSKKEYFFINRIKLLNFHNFTNTIIDLNNVGGHLFLMGDNGSGKTTVLDAIHYVLTAGEKLEFNAAARVAGSKQLGRRAQGLITRYNVDTGHLRPSGGVTYAALEIKKPNGKITTIAIGMSVNSPNDALTRWGVIKECSLEEIPFVIQDSEGERPRDKAEMKKVLGGSGYFGQPAAYCNALAERFLGGRAKFNDFCRFLSMGKAYREIASHTSDYQTLFMRLLPESDYEIFEKIIMSLKSIDESHDHLREYDARLKYVNDLASLLDVIIESNTMSATFEAVELFIKVKHLNDTIFENNQKIEQWTAELKKCEEAELALLADKNIAEKRVNELKERDASGAIAREKELRDNIDLMRKQHVSIKENLKQKQNITAQLAENQKHISTTLREELSTLMKNLPGKSINAGVEIAPVLMVLESIIHGENIDSEKLGRIFSDVIEKCGDVSNSQRPKLGRLEARIADTTFNINETSECERLLMENREVMPEWNGFASLAEDLDSNGIVYSPLYKGVEWHPDLNDTTKAAIEEFIGEEILAIITVTEEEYDHAADIIFNDYPGHKLAIIAPVDNIPRELREWAKSIFDITVCNPISLGILLRELFAKTPPELTTFNDIDIVKFRGRDNSFSGIEARFIGVDSREKAQKRKLKEVRADLREFRKSLKEYEQIRKGVKSTIRIVDNLKKLLSKALEKVREDIMTIDKMESNLSHELENLNRIKDDLQRLEDDMKKSKNRHADIIKRMKDNNLDEIENLVAIAEEELKNIENIITKKVKEVARLSVKCDEIKKKTTIVETELVEVLVAYDDKLFILKNKYKVSEAAEMVLKLREENKLHIENDATELANKHKLIAAENIATLKITINDITGVNYGFSYDQENNRLFTREGIAIKELEESLVKQLNDQHKLINEKTTELFKKLIVDTMLRTLAEKVHELEKMQRDINSLLAGRLFGNNTYKIRIKPRERYANLVKMIKTLSFYSEGTEQIENFFEDYKNEIMETPPGEIPPMLDYRNWYSYDMCVYVAGGEDGAVMNARVKSVGSGGEQAVPNYLLVLTIAHFMFSGSNIKLNTLLFDEAFYGIDSQRKDQLMGFATDLGLQLFVASPDQDGVKDEIAYSTSLLVVKDKFYNIHLYPYHWKNLDARDLFEQEEENAEFTKEL